MRDYKQHISRQVNVVTTEGDAFLGTLTSVGHDTLTLDDVVLTDARTREESKLAGTFIVERLALHYVQVI